MLIVMQHRDDGAQDLWASEKLVVSSGQNCRIVGNNTIDHIIINDNDHNRFSSLNVSIMTKTPKPPPNLFS
jgi:hypothetical protein